jgi:hypothetical protein
VLLQTCSGALLLACCIQNRTIGDEEEQRNSRGIQRESRRAAALNRGEAALDGAGARRRCALEQAARRHWRLEQRPRGALEQRRRGALEQRRRDALEERRR